MKRLLSFVLLAILALPQMKAQRYEITFVLPSTVKDSMLYIGQHYRDKLVPMDSATRSADGSYTFRGSRKWERGIYALFAPKQEKSMADFTIDGSQKFSIAYSDAVKPANATVKGSEACKAMMAYAARIDQAKAQSKDIESRKKSADPAVRAAAEKEMEQLSKEMETFQETTLNANQKWRFFQLVKMFNGPTVPEETADKSLYYRSHFWDGIDLSDHSLTRTPDLFNKMNYYFFGVLYYADADTICRYADKVLQPIEGDTLMLRYFLDFIMPRYYRSTKNIGWDQVWCYLVHRYYLSGKCTWAKPSEIANKRQTAAFLEQSLIGAMGQELYMADTNQSSNPQDWISSHRFPQKYVILWFWDPDCHHCQEQTATLKTLYDSLSAAGNKVFEVYAVGYEADVAKWKRYVKEHQLPFVNVGGSNVNIDYQEAYNVHGAPTMIILNAERRIIMNKVLPTSSILPFLERYEKDHPGGR